MNTNKSTEAHFIQMDVCSWIEQQGGTVDHSKSGLQLEKGQVIIIIEATIGEQRFKIKKLIDDYPDKIIEKIKELISSIIN